MTPTATEGTALIPRSGCAKIGCLPPWVIRLFCATISGELKFVPPSSDVTILIWPALVSQTRYKCPATSTVGVAKLPELPGMFVIVGNDVPPFDRAGELDRRRFLIIVVP
jgi:hypothetical protein